MPKYAKKHPLDVKTRTKVIKTLQQRLADAIDLQIQAKIAHWNVKGPRFFSLHGLFDEVYSNLTGIIDETAERIAALGGLATANVQNVAKTTSLKTYPVTITTGIAHVDKLSDALGKFAKDTSDAIEVMDDLDDVGTEDMLTGHLRTIEQYLWFVEAHMQEEAAKVSSVTKKK